MIRKVGILFYLPLVLLGHSVSSQIASKPVGIEFVSLRDLRYAKGHGLAETEEYLAQKGYNYMGRFEFLPPLWKHLFGKNQTENGVRFGVIVNEKDNNKFVQVELVLQNRDNWMAIRKQLKEGGYTISKESTRPDLGLTVEYSKSESKVTFSSEKDVTYGWMYWITFW